MTAPKPVRNGVTIYSKSLKYATGGGDFPVGGIVVDTVNGCDDETGEFVTLYLVAQLHHGKVAYHWLDGTDIDFEQYSGEVARRPCEDLAARMNAEDAKSRKREHLHALLALSNAIETRGVPV